MHKADKIFLIGFMGSGKTTAGRKLAALLKWKFIDLDRTVEEIAGLKIPEIFSSRGESFFRRLESRALKELKSEFNSVISTGGGTPCFGSNMEFMLENGLTVYLKMTPENLEKRLAGSAGERPLLKGISRENLLRIIEEKVAEREKWYLRSTVIADVNDDNLSDLFSMINNYFQQ